MIKVNFKNRNPKYVRKLLESNNIIYINYDEFFEVEFYDNFEYIYIMTIASIINGVWF